MKRIVLILAIALAVCCLALFGDSALSSASGNKKPGDPVHPTRSEKSGHYKSSARQTENDARNGSREIEQRFPGDEIGEETEEDPDMPKGKRRNIDENTYLSLRDEYVALRRGMEFGRPFDPGARGKAIRQMEQQEARQVEQAKRAQASGVTNFFGLVPASGPAWTAIGPATLPNGQSLSGPSIAVSGRATAIAVDPTNSLKVYLGTAQGGVWRSLDGGATWVSIFDSADSQAVGAIAIAPSSPATLYVGTGEPNQSGDSFFGVGLYRIDNADSTATLIGPINPLVSTGIANTTAFTGRSITKILVHPTDPATIFVSTANGIGGRGNSLSNSFPPLALRGIYRSTNATSAAVSVSFTKLTVTSAGSISPDTTGDRGIFDMVFEPGNSDALVCTVSGNAVAGDGGIYRSTNALASSPVFTQAQILGNSVRAALAINKVGSTVTVYAATSEPSNSSFCSASASSSGVVRKSTDGGAAWSAPLPGGQGFCGAQCTYDITIAVHPSDPNIVYIGGQARGACSDGMKRSIDGGTTFTRDDNGLHADSHALFIDPLTNPVTVFTANDGGVWKRQDTTAGTAWSNLNNSPLNTMQFVGIGVHPTDRTYMIGGTQDNGTEAQQTSGGNWINAEGGDGGYSLIDQNATDTTNVTMYHTFFNTANGQIFFDRALLTSCLSVKNSWPTLGAIACPGSVPCPEDLSPATACDNTANFRNNGIQLSDNVLFYAPMALGTGAPNTLYFGTDRLYRSTDRGDNMTIVSQSPINATGTRTPLGGTTPVSVGTPISSIAIWPQGDNYRLVGMQNGQVWATSTGSSTLVNITSGSFPANPNGSLTNKFVGRVVIDPNNKNVAYVAFSFFAPAGQGIWKITNLGAASGDAPVAPNWVAAGNGIPSVPISALVIDPINSNILYAGTDIGVYNSIDGGASWNPFGTGLPRSAVFDLAIQPTSRILRAATHGRGIWEAPLISPSPSTVELSTSNPPPVGEGAGNITIAVTRAGDTSFPATVNYSTADTAGAANCSAPSTGAASSRCDYISTIGTLHFAANEISKNFVIPLVDDSYAEGSESFTITLTNPTGSNVTLGTPATATVIITDNEVTTGTNQVDQADFFVHEHYIDFLNREPDPSGFAFWTDQITSCGADQACIEIRRINVSAAFFLSIEFQQTGYLVERLYKVAYGSAQGTSTLGGTTHQLSVPVIRLNEFLPDTQQIGRGVVIGQPGADQLLENNKQTFLEEFVLRSRFTTAYPQSITPAQFVDTLNTNAGGTLSQSKRDQLVNDLTAGVKTRAQVLRAVAEDSVLYDAETNRAFVLMQYFGYLRRNPNDAPDTDYSGYDFWLGKLNQFNGNFVNAEMVKAFIVSAEYRERFGP